MYEIGFNHDGQFSRLYIGRAIGTGVTIRSRLADHFSGNGNMRVAEYVDEAKRNHLYFRYIVCTDPKDTEARLLQRYGIGDDNKYYTWNQRLEGLESELEEDEEKKGKKNQK